MLVSEDRLAPARSHDDQSGAGASDSALVARARTGEEAAFEEIVARFQAPLFRYLCGFVGDAEEARDLLQDTFLRAYRSLAQLDDTRMLRSWLYQIAHNQACSLLRRVRLQRLLSQPRVAIQASAGELERAEVIDALARLPADQRAPLLLHLVGGFTYAEIAALLGVSEGSVRMRISRGRAAFRKAYGEE
jgi:RNA polymerase sigma-70 factor (ECF subfamily)